ncbi:unnamed protein product [Symbiodinium sp. CCMP2592]|nr:unnamed protein product [Symbiodinium sp. CCMP2592]
MAYGHVFRPATRLTIALFGADVRGGSLQASLQVGALRKESSEQQSKRKGGDDEVLARLRAHGEACPVAKMLEPATAPAASRHRSVTGAPRALLGHVGLRLAWESRTEVPCRSPTIP